MIVIKTTIQDIEIAYDKTGTGAPVLLLHGWGSNKKTFVHVSKTLSDYFTVYSLDLPGFGESSTGVPLKVEEIADLLHQFCLKEQIDTPIVLGHSYGGRIAICYAAKYPVGKLILVSSAGIRQKLKISKRFKIKVYKALRRCGLPLKMGSKDYRDADNVKRIMLVTAVNTDLKEQMKKIQAPTLLIYGSLDQVTPLQMGKTIADTIPSASLIEMEDCGHFPYLERANYFLIVLMSFLLGDSDGL